MDIYAFARAEFEKYYNCLMTVKQWGTTRTGSVTDGGWVEVSGMTSVPCRVSQNSVTRPAKQDVAATTTRDTTIYCSPDVEIPEGTLLEVTDVRGRVTTYKKSSTPINHHNTHQAIVVELSEVA